jgi:hypothetical protein
VTDASGGSLLGLLTAIDVTGGNKHMMTRGSTNGTKYAMLFHLLPSVPPMFTSKITLMNEMTDKITE